MYDPRFRALMELAGGPQDWGWAAAVVEVASGFNPYAVSDNRRGLFQMEPSFIADVLREYASDGQFLAIAHADPFLQAAAFRRFWLRHGTAEAADKLRILHYGESRARQLDSAENPDPDGYVDQVRKARAIIVAPSKPTNGEKKAA
jgi:hypothetical protein